MIILCFTLAAIQVVVFKYVWVPNYLAQQATTKKNKEFGSQWLNELMP
jgi:hypothetical protein